MSELKTIVKQSSNMTIFWILATFIGFFSNIIYTRYLPKDVFGDFTLMRTIINLFAIYAMFGLNHGFLRQGSLALGREQPEVYKEIQNYTITFSLIISLVVCAIVFFCAGPISTYIFKKPSITNLVRFCSFVIPIQLIGNMTLVLFKVNKKADTGQFLYTILYFVLQLLFFYLLTFFLKDEPLIIISFIVANFIYLIILLYYQKKFNVKYSLKLEKKEKKALYNISVPMFFAATFSQSQRWGDTLFLGILGTNAQVGVYYIALRISSFISIPQNAFTQIFLPIAGRLMGKGKHSELNDLYKTITRLIFISGSLIFGVIYFMQSYLLSMFGHFYQNASVVLIYLLISETVDFGVGPAKELITMSGGGKINLVNSIITLAINILGSYLLIPQYGIIGAAIANALTNISMNLIAVIELIIIYKLSPFNIKYFVIIAIFIICLIGTSFLPVINISKAIFFGVVLTSIYIFGVLNKEEKDLFINMIKRRGKKLKNKTEASN